MPSRSNPNAPTKTKRKTARALKSKRRATQHRLAAAHPLATHTRVTRPTSQALRRRAAGERRGSARAKKVEREEGEGGMDLVEGEGEGGKEREGDGKEGGEGKEKEMEVDKVD